MRLPNLLATRAGRLAAFFALYLTEGIPLGFTATAVATQMRRQGSDRPRSAPSSARSTCRGRSSGRSGRSSTCSRRIAWAAARWIVITQVLMVAVAAGGDARQLPEQLRSSRSSSCHNIFGATQDVAIDALAVNTLPEHERGLANGVMFAGAYLGQAIGGAACCS